MANTYYDSELTAAEIEAALEAIDGVIAPANNGKVLVVDNGKISAKPVTDYIDLNLQAKTATPSASQQTILPGSGYNGLSAVTVEGVIAPNLIAGNIKKDVVINVGTSTDDDSVMSVTGSYEGGITPTGTINISQNGIVDVTDYASANVNVSGGGEEWSTLSNYIEASGGQYINTEYVINQNSKIEVVANVPDNSLSYPTIFGSRNNSSNEVVIYSEFGGGNIAMVWANGDSSFFSRYGRSHIGKKSLFSMEGNGDIQLKTVDGYGFKLNGTPGSSLSSLPIYVFALNDNGNPNGVTYCSMKLYRIRIFESDTLLHEYVPYIDGSNIVCLRNTVTGDLKYNAGTGTFAYGTDS